MIATETLQRIVDGELSREALSAALREVDRHPSDWRQVALALLEDQQWSKGVVALQRQTELKSLLADESPQPQIQSIASHELRTVELQSPSSIEPSLRLVPAFWSALAASFLLAIGFYSGAFLARSQNQAVGSSNDLIAQRHVDIKDGQLDLVEHGSILNSPLNPDMKMVMNGPGSKTKEIPIYDFEEVDTAVLWAKENYEVAKWNEQLRRRGYELDVKPEYYTGRLNDGRQLIVPVKNVALKPYGL
jgi:hypothetical protein